MSIPTSAYIIRLISYCVPQNPIDIVDVCARARVYICMYVYQNQPIFETMIRDLQIKIIWGHASNYLCATLLSFFREREITVPNHIEFKSSNGF